ncbi:MAG: 6-bladed beta-propeller [Candidatus Aminicenantes bacterium]|nr:6-bladed beta-propeller [Candidatus Aminicenantes bacterium]
MVSLKLLKSFNLDQSSSPIGRLYDFSVDENGHIYIPDSALAHIKIYNSNGKLLQIFGQKGAGPGEFIDPTGIAISLDKIVIADIGQLKYIIFNRNFKELKRIFYLMSGHDFIIKDKFIIANEYYQDNDGKKYKGVLINIEDNSVKGLIQLKKRQNDP